MWIVGDHPKGVPPNNEGLLRVYTHNQLSELRHVWVFLDVSKSWSTCMYPKNVDSISQLSFVGSFREASALQNHLTRRGSPSVFLIEYLIWFINIVDYPVIHGCGSRATVPSSCSHPINYNQSTTQWEYPKPLPVAVIGKPSTSQPPMMDVSPPNSICIHIHQTNQPWGRGRPIEQLAQKSIIT